MVIEGAYPECEKCGSHNTIIYKNGRGICSRCGTDQLDYETSQMVCNLKRYGFIELRNYEKPTFFEKLFGLKTKRLESHYQYQSNTYIIAKHIPGSSNMRILVGDEEIIFNYYGTFSYIEKQLDNIFNDKKLIRRLKLKKIENEQNNN